LPQLPLPARRALSARQRSQNLVEFGLSVAAIAFVALLGFGALGRAQAAYWGAESAALNVPPPPSSPWIHDTKVADLNCGLAAANPAPVPAGVTITCTNQTVSDNYIDPSQWQAPKGTLALYLDTSPPSVVASCPLTILTTGVSVCSSLSWTPPAGLIGSTVYHLSLQYQPVGNWFANSSASVPVQFVTNYVLYLPNSPACQDVTGLPTLTVELGRPLTCLAGLQDASNPASPAPVSGAKIWWATTNADPSPSSPDRGIGMFTCATLNLADFFNTSTTTPCPSPSPIPSAKDSQALGSCVTNSSGMCSIVYRRLYDDPTGLGVGATPTLGLVATDQATPTPHQLGAPITLPAPIKVVSPSSAHASLLLGTCANNYDPSHLTLVAQKSTDVPSPVFGTVTFPAIHDMDIDTHGGSATTSFGCGGVVYDALQTLNPSANCTLSPSLTCPATSGSLSAVQQQAFPPTGTLTISWSNIASVYLNGSPTPSISPVTCTLARMDNSSPTGPPQAAGQAPWMSSCGYTFQIKGQVGGPQESITITYGGDSGHSSAPTTACPASTCTPWTYTMNIDFT
jgi:hypothetical protein